MIQIKEVTRAHPRFGYRRVAAVASASHERVRRLWRPYGFRLGSQRISRRTPRPPQPRIHHAEYPNQVWTYDFLHDTLATGQKFKTLSILDEFTRECLLIKVGRSIRSIEVIAGLTCLMHTRGKPEFIRSDNGSEFTATGVRQWLNDNKVGPSFIEPGHPWQNGYVESFHGKFRDECLNRAWFQSYSEAEVMVEQWRQYYNTQRPHSSLDYRTPAQFAGEQQKS